MVPPALREQPGGVARTCEVQTNMNDSPSRLSFAMSPPENSAFTAEAATSMIGQDMTVEGRPARVVATELRDDGAIWLTVEGDLDFGVIAAPMLRSLSFREDA